MPQFADKTVIGSIWVVVLFFMTMIENKQQKMTMKLDKSQNTPFEV